MISSPDIEVLNSIENPSDSASVISWANLSMKFAVSSWDSTIRIYKVDQSSIEKSYLKSDLIFGVDDPCLSLSWASDDTQIFAGSINNSIYTLDIAEQKTSVLGEHQGPVKDVYWLSHLGLVASLSYDQTLKFWDPKNPGTAHSSFSLQYKPLCSAFVYPTLAIATSSEKLLFLNVSKIDSIINYINDYRDSSLGMGSIILSIDLFTNGKGFALGSHDGRGNISNLIINNDRYEISNIMTFKAQKKDNGGTNNAHLYPVNAVGFNKRYDYNIFTAGGEGNLNLWDFQAKNKVKSLALNSPITCAKVDPSGMLLAYATGDDYSHGVEKYQTMRPKICVHPLLESEIKYAKH